MNTIQRIGKLIVSNQADILGWLTLIIPLLISQIRARPNNPIVHRHNEIQDHFMYQMKISFLFSIIIVIPNYLYYLAGKIVLALQQYKGIILFITIPSAILFCFYKEFEFDLVGQKSIKYCFIIRLLSLLPVIGSAIFFFMACNDSSVFLMSSFALSVCYVICGIGVMRFIDDHYYYDYKNVKLTFFDKTEMIKTQIDRIGIQGKWVTVVGYTGKEKHLPLTQLQKIEYLSSSKFFVGCRCEEHKKVFYILGLFMYILQFHYAFSTILPIPYETILLPVQSIEMHPGDYYQLDAVSTMGESKLMYRSSNEEIVTVSENGLIHVRDGIAGKRKKVEVTVMGEVGSSDQIIIYIDN